MMHKEKETPLFTIPEETSWHFERILKPDDKTIGNYVLIQPGALDIAKVLAAYFHHPVPAYNIASIEIVYNEQLNRLFYGQMKMMNVRKGNIKYTPSWRTKTHGLEKQHRENTHQLLENLAESHHDTDVPNMSILPLWHGTSDDVSEYIFNMGYGIFLSNDPTFVTDDGYFGKGVYTAHEAEYSFRSYAQKHGDKAVLLLNWVSSFEAYPVIDGDMPHLRGKMGGYDQCDAHFIPVRSNQHPHTNVYVPCGINEPHHYQEIVVFSPAQCLPRYRVKLIKSSPQFNIIIDDTAYQMGLDCLGLGQYGMVAEAFENACDAGHPAAAIRLHWLHSGASGVVSANTPELAKYQNPPQSTVEYLKRKANFKGENDQESQFNLAWCHQHGLGTPASPAKAAQYYWLAARQWHREAQYQLGVCCSTGTGVKQDIKKAIFYYEQAAAKGHAHANYLLSQCYELGLGVSPNEAKAAHYKQAAQKSHHPKLSGMPSFMPHAHTGDKKDKETIARLEQTLQAKDKMLTQKDSQLIQQSAAINQAEQKIHQLTQTLQANNKTLAEKETQSAENASVIGKLKLRLDHSETKLMESESNLTQAEKALQASKDEALSLQLQLKEYQKQASKPVKISDNPFTTFQPMPSIKPSFQPTPQDQKDVELLFKWDTEGHLLEAEKLLQKSPHLALVKGTVTDLSGRRFTNTSAFQYAAWALDIEMCELMLKYFDQSGAVAADIQLNELEKNPGSHGAHYDIDPLLKKTQEYISNYSQWDQAKREQHWQKEVGGEQRKCPAWLIYAWCEKGADVAWVKKDLKNIKVIRQYNEGHIKWWFENKYNGGCGVGATWSCARGWAEGAVAVHGGGDMGGGLSARMHIRHDRDFGQSVKPNRHEALTSLKAKLESKTTTGLKK